MRPNGLVVALLLSLPLGVATLHAAPEPDPVPAFLKALEQPACQEAKSSSTGVLDTQALQIYPDCAVSCSTDGCAGGQVNDPCISSITLEWGYCMPINNNCGEPQRSKCYCRV